MTAATGEGTALATLLGLLAVVGSLALAQPARAQSNEAGARAALDEARSQESGVLDQLNEVDRQLDQVRSELATLQERSSELEGRRRVHEDEAAVAQARLDLLADQVRDQLAGLYRLQRRGLARIVFSADDPSEIRRVARYLQAIVEADTHRLREYREVLSTRYEAVEAADRDLEAIEALRTELRLKEAELRDQRARRVELLAEIRDKREVAYRVLREAGMAPEVLRREIEAAAPAEPESGPANFRASFGRLPWPVRGRLTRRFGPYKDALTGDQLNSTGIDVAADYGSPIRAVAAGTVRLVNFVPRYGQTVVLSHGDYTTVYAHCNGVLVRRGQEVAAGDVIALVGNSGLVDESVGYVLTFEVRYHDSHQDPLAWLQPL